MDRRLTRTSARGLRVGGVLAALFSLPGCPSRATPPAPPAPLAMPSAVRGTLGGTAPLGDVPKRAEGAGAGPGVILASGLLSEAERLGAFVELSTETCLLAYARGAASVEDIDLALYSAEGESLAADEWPDASPSLLFCPSLAQKAYVTAQAIRGDGFAAIGVHFVPRSHVDAVARAVGVRAGRSGLRSADVDPIVSAHRRVLGGRFEELRRIELPIDSRAAAHAPMLVEKGRCLDVLVVAPDDTAALDVEVLDGEGRSLARGREDGRRRSVTLCSDVAMPATLRVRPHTGHGTVIVVLSRADSDSGRDGFLRPELFWMAPTGTPTENARARSLALTRAGYGQPLWESRTALEFFQIRSSEVDLRLVESPCARLDVVAGPPTSLLYANLWDGSGALLGQGDGHRGAVIYGCASVRATLELESQGRAGGAQIALRKEPWADPILRTRPLAASRMLSRMARGPLSLMEGVAVGVRSVEIDADQKQSFTARVPASSCLRVAVGAAGHGSGVTLRVVDTADSIELDRSHGAHSAVVQACARQEILARFELLAIAGKMGAIVGERMSK